VAKLRNPNKQTTVLTLEEKLAAIGVMTATQQLSSETIAYVDLEETLADAIISFAETSDEQRWLGPGLAWVDVHGATVIIEKLTKILKSRASHGSNVEFASLLASFALQHGHKRWRTLKSLAPNFPRLIGHPDLAASLVKLRGDEEWSRDVNFIIPKGSVLPQRKWTLSQTSLAALNPQYRNRLIYGAQWRADIITAIDRGARTPSEASRASGASYEPCHRVFRELQAAGVVAAKTG
jgi:hypothetical protein